jgi:hypothetical protein
VVWSGNAAALQGDPRQRRASGREGARFVAQRVLGTSGEREEPLPCPGGLNDTGEAGRREAGRTVRQCLRLEMPQRPVPQCPIRHLVTLTSSDDRGGHCGGWRCGVPYSDAERASGQGQQLHQLPQGMVGVVQSRDQARCGEGGELVVVVWDRDSAWL